MKQDIQVNYSILREIVKEIKVYREASEEIEKTLKNVNDMLEENKGESIEKLKNLYEEIKIDYDSCYKELMDLENIISEYIETMTGIISPIDEGAMVRVDRNDIWWNLNDIDTACTHIRNIPYLIGGNFDFSGIIQDEDEEKRAEENEVKVNNIMSIVSKGAECILTDLQEMKNIFNSKVVNYEEIDNSFATRGKILYKNYSSGGERFQDFIDGLWESVTDFFTVLLEAVVDLVVGLASLAFGLLEGACIYLLDAVFSSIEPIDGEKPEWMKWIHTKKEEYDTMLDNLTLYDLIEGYTQHVSDKWDEKGALYGVTYVITDLILIDKGLGKIKGVNKLDDVGKVDPKKVMRNIEDSKIAREASEYGKLADFEKSFNTLLKDKNLKGLVDDIGKNVDAKKIYDNKLRMIDSTNLDEIRRITRETIDELKVGNPNVYDEIGKSKYFDEVYKMVSKPIGSLLRNKSKVVRTKLSDSMTTFKNSEEYINLSNTQRRKIDRKLKSLTKGNVATADVAIAGVKKEFSAHSQIHSMESLGADVMDFSYTPAESERIFKNYVVDEFPRYNDTEAKILEDIASKIKDTNIKGEVNLFTELDTCQSCTNIILEFRAKYPNIKLNIFTNNTVCR